HHEPPALETRDELDGAYLCALRFQAGQLTAIDSAFAQQENLSVAIYGARQRGNDFPDIFLRRTDQNQRRAIQVLVPFYRMTCADRVCDPAGLPVGLRRHSAQVAS